MMCCPGLKELTNLKSKSKSDIGFPLKLQVTIYKLQCQKGIDYCIGGYKLQYHPLRESLKRIFDTRHKSKVVCIIECVSKLHQYIYKCNKNSFFGSISKYNQQKVLQH